MSLHINNENQPTDNFKRNVNTLQSQLPAMLEDFKKYYVFFNKNPENHEYEQMFQTIENNVNNVNVELISMSNNLQTNINIINKKLVVVDVSIKKEKEKNKKLKKQLGMIENKNNASTELITDYKKMYDFEYLRNWSLFLSILTCLFVIKKVTTK